MVARKLYVSQVIVEYNGKEIIRVKLKNGELEDKKIYKVATSDYLHEQNDEEVNVG